MMIHDLHFTVWWYDVCTPAVSANVCYISLGDAHSHPRVLSLPSTDLYLQFSCLWDHHSSPFMYQREFLFTGSRSFSSRFQQERNLFKDIGYLLESPGKQRTRHGGHLCGQPPSHWCCRLLWGCTWRWTPPLGCLLPLPLGARWIHCHPCLVPASQWHVASCERIWLVVS